VLLFLLLPFFFSGGPLRYAINFCTGDAPTAKSAARKQWAMCLHRFADPQLGTWNVTTLSAQVVT